MQHLLGQIIGGCSLGLGLICFLFLWFGKPGFLVCPRGGFLNFARTTSQSFLTEVNIKEVVGTLNLKICG